jgi:cytidyltransferase-like protein
MMSRNCDRSAIDKVIRGIILSEILAKILSSDMNITQYLSDINVLLDKLIPMNTGLTNMVYQIPAGDTTDSAPLVMKRYHPNENNFTARRRELYEQLTRLRVTPHITKYLKDGHVEQFVPGNIITSYLAGNLTTHLASVIGNFHRQASELATGSIQFWDWIDDEYLKLDNSSKAQIATYFGEVGDIPIQIRRMRRVLDTLDIPISICHNDLNLTNLLLDSDQTIHMIDWEWVGVNPCVFDLSALVYHLHLGEHETELFCQAYQSSFQKIPDLSRYIKMYLAPNRLWWGLWALNRLSECQKHSDRWYKLQNLADNCFLLYKSLLSTYFPPTVYVVGVFDLLHLGHINLLNKAKQYTKGGRLVVGVHGDKLVEAYKRIPINNHETRVSMISSLTGVDQVIPNASSCRDCNAEWYQKYGIDYHIAGEDNQFYTGQRSLGIFRVLDSEYKVHTTDIIKKLSD